MSKIVPHLWFDRQAKEAAEFYLSIFPNSRKLYQTIIKDTPSGDCDFLGIELFGQEFMMISAGPYFTINSSISFLIECIDKEEAYSIFSKLLENEDELESFEDYNFGLISRVEDRYGVSWMIQYQPTASTQRISPVLLFMGSNFGKVVEAVEFYVSVFKNASLDEHWLVNDDLDYEDRVFNTQIYFTLEGQTFRAFEKFTMEECFFNEGVSLLVYADTQDEIDNYWNALSAVPEAEQCGWLKDKYGLSWQISPRIMNEMMLDGNEERLGAVTRCMLQMKKLDMNELQRVYDQHS